jgi:regulator of protease activity HflC (stomatin/prohibitin superfamily)
MNGGVQDNTIREGWHIVPPTKKVRLFTIGNEQLLLTKDEREGSKEDDSFKVSTADDASISISFQMSYRFKQDTLVNTYKKFKGMDGEKIVDNRVKPVLKSKVSEVTTNYSMMDIYSGNRSEINNKLTDYLGNAFSSEYGIEVLDASIIDVHPDKKLKQAIDNRVTALQKKQQAEAEQETVRVEAETKMIRAKNEADIKVTEANAKAEANTILSESITDNLIKMKEAEARYKHGWITVQGADTIVTKD